MRERRPGQLLVGVSVRALAQSAARAGYRCVSVDAFGDRDHRAVVDELRRPRPDGDGSGEGGGGLAAALTALATGAPGEELTYGAPFENHPRLIEQLSRGRRLLGNPPPRVAEARRPERLASAAAAIGIPGPAVRSAPPPPGDRRRWLRKPLRGGGGHGVGFASAGGGGDGPHYYQEWLPGRPVSILFLGDGRDARLLGVTELLAGDPELGAPGFAYCGSLWPARPDVPIEPARRLARGLTERFGLRGLNGVDAIVQGGRIRPVELNPRPTAAMELLEEAAPTPLFAWHRRACAGSLPGVDLVPAPGRRVRGKAIVRAPGPLRAPAAERLGAPWAADLPDPGRRVGTGQPICTVLAEGEGHADCLRELRSLARRAVRACEREDPGGRSDRHGRPREREEAVTERGSTREREVGT